MGFPDWTTKPIPNLSLSASGLIALADLSTIAQRTAITGGSSWMDSLLLAPGLQYQQAADELVKGSGVDAIVDAVEGRDGKPTTFKINNAATAHYIQKIARPGQQVTLDVGSLPASKARYRLKRSDSGMRESLVCSPVFVYHCVVECDEADERRHRRNRLGRRRDARPGRGVARVVRGKPGLDGAGIRVSDSHPRL